MRFRHAAILTACLAGAAPASANDLELFEGLIPGEPLEQEELGQIFGKGVNLSFQLADGSLVSLDNATFSPIQNQTSSIFNTSGITSTVPVIGDNNTVNIIVDIDLRLNTIEILNSPGAAPIFSGSVEGGGGQVLDLGQ